MSDLFVGLMSGTSMDGIDAALVRFEGPGLEILATHSHAYPEALQAALRAAILQPLDEALDVSGELDRGVGECFRDAALAVIEKGGREPEDVVAIGSHGQTLRHQPDAVPPFSLQIGDADLIARGTGVDTVADLRTADIEAGGQGAPLVPPFHAYLFGSDIENRAVVNVGGIANVTILPADGSDVTGFDTGPGNGLMNVWMRRHRGEDYDRDGKWAAGGSVLEALLEQMLDDPYFALPPPKSTGFEYFNAAWLEAFDLVDCDARDVQTTLCELSVRGIANAIRDHAANTDAIFVCGGGAYNPEFMRRLGAAVNGVPVATTATAGLEPGWVEAVAFAWLARRRINQETGNLPSVTGASRKVLLGVIHSAGS